MKVNARATLLHRIIAGLFKVFKGLWYKYKVGNEHQRYV